ncbi:Glutamyl-Q tRNA(Asp) synthetase [hydrothermal vent metagenome]|uniref:Glutamyl-Q tRNA(Asp) synthetase n=1 Tax=hydrothermal vent metagenome TaxID=652676 RepID=A0A3B0TGV2_9ZZZZ
MNISPQIITRFAPSPTGHLHLGHAYSARLAHDFARARDGRFLLRIEDIDQGRCKAEYESAIYEDMKWIGLTWETPVRRQSDHMDDYRQALDILDRKGVLFPCFCTRKDIRREIADSGRAAHSSEGPLYPGTCRTLTMAERQLRLDADTPHALRLDMAKALELLGDETLIWKDIDAGEQIANPETLLRTLGDAVLARKDIPTSYHLSVVVDDHLQNISHVIRGKDLFQATHLHRLLQFLLNYNTPQYLHHKLLTDDKGWRYAKRDNSKTLKFMRENGEEVAWASFF